MTAADCRDALQELANVTLKYHIPIRFGDNGRAKARYIFSGEGCSTQPGTVTPPTGLSKEDAECLAIGQEIAAHANGDTETLAKIAKGQRVA